MNFKDAQSEIKRHLAKQDANCGCQRFFQKFLTKDHGEVAANVQAVRRWTMNGPTTSLRKHPYGDIFVEGIQDVLAAAKDHNEVILRILYFEYRIREYNNTENVKRARAGKHPRHGRSKRTRHQRDFLRWHYDEAGERL